MTAPAHQFLYVARDPSLGSASLAPMLPLTLIGSESLSTFGLVHRGAAISVLPYALGVQLGFDWEQQTRSVELSRNMDSVEARVVVLSVVVASFPPASLAFAWAQTGAFSIILGQVNFFQEFDICFFRSRGMFEVRPNTVRRADSRPNCLAVVCHQTVSLKFALGHAHLQGF